MKTKHRQQLDSLKQRLESSKTRAGAAENRCSTLSKQMKEEKKLRVEEGECAGELTDMLEALQQ